MESFRDFTIDAEEQNSSSRTIDSVNVVDLNADLVTKDFQSD